MKMGVLFAQKMISGNKWHYVANAWESNDKLPLRICPGCSIPELYQSPD
jgi:hypothetical protein